MFKSKLFSVLGLAAALAVSTGLTAGDDKPAAAKLGEKAPAFELTDLNGKQVMRRRRSNSRRSTA